MGATPVFGLATEGVSSWSRQRITFKREETVGVEKGKVETREELLKQTEEIDNRGAMRNRKFSYYSWLEGGRKIRQNN